MNKVHEAIEIIKECQQIHADYVEWQEANPDWRKLCIPDQNTGGPEHHRLWVEKYETVLKALGELESLQEAYEELSAAYKERDREVEEMIAERRVDRLPSGW